MAKSTRKGTWIGFELQFAKNVTINDWYHNVRAGYDNHYKLGTSHHSLYVAEHQNYLIGLVVNYKDHRLYLEAVNQGEILEVVRREIEEGHEGIEANLFAINPANLNGVFASLFGTISDTKLSKLFRKVHDRTKKNLMALHMETLQNDNPDYTPEILKQKVNQDFNGDFLFTFKVSTHDIDSAISHFKSLERIRIGFADGLPPDPWFTPMTNTAKRAKIEFTLDKKCNAVETGSKIKSLLRKSPTYDALRIYGKSLLNEETSVVIGENKQGFGRFVYDDYISGLPNRWPTDISSCTSTKMILAVMKEYSAAFGNPPKVKKLKNT